jgi:hypothetical protein
MDHRWTFADCRAEHGDTYGRILAKNRYSICYSQMANIRMYITGTSGWLETNARLVVVDTVDRTSKAVSRTIGFDQRGRYEYSEGLVLTPEQRLALERAFDDQSVTVKARCEGLGGASCTESEKDVATGEDMADVLSGSRTYEMRFSAGKTASDPRAVSSRFPEATKFYASDKVSFHHLHTDVIGELSGFTLTGTFRCDEAPYLGVKTPGCVWRELQSEQTDPANRISIQAVYPIQYAVAPQWADHVLGAYRNPLRTTPYITDPALTNGAIQVADPYGWGSQWNIPGGLDFPASAPKALHRLYEGVLSTDPSALQRGRNNENGKDRACNRLVAPAGQQCDEYPFRSTYEGTYYTVDQATKTQPWKFSVKYIDATHNGDAGRDLKNFYRWGRVLAVGDEFRVRVYNGSTPIERQAGREAYDERKAKERRNARAELAAIPDEDLCTHPQLGGWYACDYGETWWKYDNGTVEVFVVGSDNQVYHKWTRADGSWTPDWVSMGGQVTSGVEVVDGHGATLKITAMGTDGLPYYRERNPLTGSWTEWHR